MCGQPHRRPAAGPAEPMWTPLAREGEVRLTDLEEMRPMRAGSSRTSATMPAGRIVGGIPHSKGTLAWLLRNRIYLGEIVHKGESHPGEHQAIIDPETFNAVQAQLLEGFMLEEVGKRAPDGSEGMAREAARDLRKSSFAPDVALVSLREAAKRSRTSPAPLIQLQAELPTPSPGLKSSWSAKGRSRSTGRSRTGDVAPSHLAWKPPRAHSAARNPRSDRPQGRDEANGNQGVRSHHQRHCPRNGLAAGDDTISRRARAPASRSESAATSAIRAR
jgi:hypothetical protein